MEQLIGHTTAIGQVTRESGNILGNSLKTIYSRITTMSGSIEMLEKAGISVYDSFGQLRNVGDILDDLGQGFSSLNSETQQQLALQLAGRFQLSRFLTLMQQYEQSQKSTETAINSHNSALNENERYLDSHAAKLNKMRNALTATFIETGQSFADEAIVTFAETVTTALKTLNSVIQSIGAIPTILLGAVPVFMLLSRNITAFVTAQNASTTATTTNIGAMRQLILAQRQLQTSTTSLSSSFGILNPMLNTTTRSIQMKTMATNALAGAVRGLGMTFRGLLAATGVGLGLMAVGFVLDKIISSISKAKEEAREFEKELNKLTSTYGTHTKQVDELVSTYEKLSNRVSLGELASDDEEYLKVQQELYQLLPHLAESVDEKGQAHLRTAEAIRTEILALEELRALESKKFLENFNKTLKDVNEEISEIENKINRIGRANPRANSISGGISSIPTGSLSTEEQIKKVIEERKLNGVIEERTKLLTQLLTSEAEVLGYRSQITQADQKYTEELIKQNLHLLDTSEGTVELTDKIKLLAGNLGELRSNLGNNVDGLIEVGVAIEDLPTDKLGIFEALSSAIENGYTDFDQWKGALESAGLTATQAVRFIQNLKKSIIDTSSGLELYYDENQRVRIAQEDLQNVIDDGITIYDKYGNVVDDVATLLSGSADSTWKNISASEALFNVTAQQLTQTKEAIELIQLLSQVENLNAQQKQHMERAIQHLESIYPHLSGRIQENIHWLYQEAIFMEEVNKTSGKMAEVMSGNADATTKAIVQTVNDRINAYNAEMDALSLLAQERNKLVEVLRNQDDTIGMQTEDMQRYVGMTIQLSDQRAKLAEYRDSAVKAISGFNSHMDNKGKNSSSGSKGSSSSSTADQPNQRELIDALIREINATHQLTQAENELTKARLDVAKSQNDYNAQLEQSNKLLTGQAKQLNDLNYANQRLHQTANQVRNNSPFDTSQWFDANNNETVAFINQYNQASKSQQEQMTETFNKLQKLKNAYMDNASAIQSLNKTMSETRFERDQIHIERFSSLMEGVDRSIKKSQLTREQYEEGTNDFIQSIQEEIKHLEYKQQLYNREAEEIKKILQNTALTKQETEYWTKALSDNTLAQLENMNAIRRNNQAIKQAQENLANDIVNLYKDMYRKQNQIVQEGLNQQLKHLEDTHRRKIEMLDEELKKFEDVINQQLRLLDDEANEDDFQKRLSELQEEESGTRKQIAELSIDTSMEATAKRADLEKQLQNTLKQIEDLQTKRTRDLRRQNLRDLQEQKRKEIQLEKDTATENYNIEKSRLDAEKSYWDRHYENLIEDERRFRQMREDIISGHFNHIISDLTNFELEMQRHMGTIGESISRNLIDKLNEARAALANLGSGSSSSGGWISGSASGGGSGTSSGSGSSSGGNSSIGMSSTIAQMQANSAAWHSASASERKRLEEENQRLGSNMGAQYINGAWYKNGNRIYHNGGFVGSKTPSKIGDLVDKLFNTKPNEQVVKSLIGELQIPPQNIGNIIPNLQNTISTIMSKGGQILNNYHLAINIDNMNGTKKDAQNLSATLVEGIRKLGGKI